MKRDSGLAILFAFFLPGLGHVYMGRVLFGLFLMAMWPLTWVVAIVMFPLAVNMTAEGNFAWFLFLTLPGLFWAGNIWHVKQISKD
jgi:hypothetical protein